MSIISYNLPYSLHNKLTLFLIEDLSLSLPTSGYLGSIPGVHILGKSSGVDQFLAQSRQLSRRLQVIVWQTGDISSVQMADYLQQMTLYFPHSGIVAVTSGDNPRLLHRLLRLGVPGIVSGLESPAILLQCLQTVALGAVCHGPCVRKLLSSRYKNLAEWQTFTRTERRIIPLLAAGLPDKAIQEQLCIASSTLDNHRTSIYSKLREFGYSVFSKAELVVWYQNSGLSVAD